MNDPAAVQDAARALREARYVVAMTGAGISVESGIPPFRGPNGLWTKYGEPPLNGFEKFLADPARAWEERLHPVGPMKELWKRLHAALPNDGHRALARLEEAGIVRHLITQNIDNLHSDAGSRAVTEIHGNATLVRCLQCGERRPAADIDTTTLPPLCDTCGGVLKGDTVSFGEPIPPDAMRSCEVQAERCDCMLLVGTSATVYPAAQFPIDVRRRGGFLIEVNPEPTELSAICQLSLNGGAGEVLTALQHRLRARQA